MDREVVTEDGRTLLVFDSGEDGPPILSIHGTGMGRRPYPPYLTMATGRGVRVLSFDRPGLGGSTRNPGYRLPDCAADVRAMAAALNIERLLVWGVSGGAPFAVACAALLPDLVVAAAELGGPSPASPDETPAILTDPEARRQELETDAAADRERDVPGWIDVLTETGLPPADVATLKSAAAQWFADDARDAFAPGADGWFDEQWAVAQPWGFELGSIRIPFLIVHGLLDPWVGPQAAREFAAGIPSAELRLLEDNGHLSPLDRLDEIVDWLLAYY